MSTRPSREIVRKARIRFTVPRRPLHHIDRRVRSVVVKLSSVPVLHRKCALVAVDVPTKNQIRMVLIERGLRLFSENLSHSSWGVAFAVVGAVQGAVEMHEGPRGGGSVTVCFFQEVVHPSHLVCSKVGRVNGRFAVSCKKMCQTFYAPLVVHCSKRAKARTRANKQWYEIVSK